MIPMLGGTHAGLAVQDELRAAVRSAAADKVRAVKVLADPKAECLTLGGTVPEGASLAEDFAAIAALLEDAVPCLALVRLKDAAGTVPGARDASWGMLAWTPGDSPVRLRTLCAGSRKTVKGEFSDVKFTEYHATERDEVTLAQFVDATRELTEADRHAAMSQAEIDREETKKEVAKEQAAAPKMLAGLVALQIKAQPSFEAALKQVIAEDGNACLGKLSGAKGEELGGEVLADAARPALLAGRLPTEEPCYVIFRPAENRLVVLSWLPDGAPARARMKFSTFKSSVLDVIRQLAPGCSVQQCEVSDEEDLTDDLLAEKASAAAAGGAAAAAAPKPGGFKPPAGGFALPGMGGGGYGGGKPPPGAVRMPGMGPGDKIG